MTTKTLTVTEQHMAMTNDFFSQFDNRFGYGFHHGGLDAPSLILTGCCISGFADDGTRVNQPGIHTRAGWEPKEPKEPKTK